VTFSSTLGSVTGSAPINASGIATATFSSNQTGSATITASWDGAQAQIPVAVTAGPPHSIIIECEPSAIECDGNSFATVTGTITDIAGNPVTDGTVATFSVAPDGLGGGNGTVTPEARSTNGKVTALVFSRNPSGGTSLPGTATVTAKVERTKQPVGIPAPTADIENHETQVLFTSLDVAEIHIGADPLNVRALDFVGNTVSISAVVYDSHHNPVPDGTAVYFTATQGMIYGNSGTAGKVAMSVTSNGRASATLVTDAPGFSCNGLVDVTAVSGDKSVTVAGLVTFSGPPSTPNCSISIDKAVLAGAEDASPVTIVVRDVNGNPVTNDVSINVTTDKGTISGSTQLIGGVAMVTLHTSADTGKPTPSGPGTITVTMDSGHSDPIVTLQAGFTVL
jgi:hypothetical protein